eukprot:1595660-Pleurochrysis_carterae.AAC.2
MSQEMGSCWPLPDDLWPVPRPSLPLSMPTSSGEVLCMRPPTGMCASANVSWYLFATNARCSRCAR